MVEEVVLIFFFDELFCNSLKGFTFFLLISLFLPLSWGK